MYAALSPRLTHLSPVRDCSIKVTAGSFYYIVVSGSAPADAGAFTLTLANSALAT